jgi:DNA-binding protein H-NS
LRALALEYIRTMRAVRNPREKTAKSRAQRGTGVMDRAKHSGRLPDLTSLSDDDLAALVGLVEEELAARRDRKRAEFFLSIREQAQALGVAPEELVAALGRKQERPASPDRRAKVAPKYRNPANPSETWAGRGVKPRWMQALLAQGKDMEEFKITS